MFLSPEIVINWKKNYINIFKAAYKSNLEGII